MTVKKMSGTKIQKLYMQHVQSAGFRMLSAFSQRAEKATGEIRDEYLYSVRVRWK